MMADSGFTLGGDSGATLGEESGGTLGNPPPDRSVTRVFDVRRDLDAELSAFESSLDQPVASRSVENDGPNRIRVVWFLL